MVQVSRTKEYLLAVAGTQYWPAGFLACGFFGVLCGMPCAISWPTSKSSFCWHCSFLSLRVSALVMKF